MAATTNEKGGPVRQDRPWSQEDILELIHQHSVLLAALNTIADFPCICLTDSSFIPGTDECESCIARAVLAKAQPQKA